MIATITSVPEILHIRSEASLRGWAIAGQIRRDLFISTGHVLSPNASKHNEFKVPKKRGVDKTPPQVQLYDNKLFAQWQQQMSVAIHEGYNVIATAATSCGKTWVANLTVAHEILSRDNCTALIVSPNSEVMRETVHDISTQHSKRYLHGARMLDTITRNFATYDEGQRPTAQIMVVSVESLTEWITNPVNETFVKKLKFIIFDEVHLPSVTNGLWWTQYVPHSAQLILLSATLGDPESVKDTVKAMQALAPERAQKIAVISYNIRPIPLQPLLFKGCERPADSLISPSLQKAGKLVCIINQFDPTIRDIRALERDIAIPASREDQYHLGQEVIKRHQDSISAKLDAALTDVKLTPTVQNVYNALCYLYSNGMQPAMCFHSTAEATKSFAEKLVAHIALIEREDPECREAQKLKDRYEKEQFRERDTEEKKKEDEYKPMKLHPAENRKTGDTYAPKEKRSTFDIFAVNRILNKWHFPSDLKDIPTRKVPQWIQDCLEMGIGVYVSTMPTHLKHYVFDSFKEGKLSFMLADSSISVGVNLPIRTVLLCGNDLTHTLYRQAGGRAGRRGMDDQGYMLHFMPKEQVKSYLSHNIPPVALDVQKYMSYTDLIRLMVPENLDKYYVDNDKDIWRRIQYKRNGKGKEPRPAPAPFDDKLFPVASYKKGILDLYMSTLSQTEARQCEEHISLILKDQLHYHRLTNLTKTLPEASGSVLMIKFLMSGILHKFDVMEFLELMSIMFRRIEKPSVLADGEKESDYYIPQFDRFPGILQTLQNYGDRYQLGIDFSRPIHRYFSDFFREGVLRTEHMESIERMGDWLYCIKTQISKVAPTKVHTREVDGERIKETINCDKFAELLEKADDLYLISRRRTM